MRKLVVLALIAAADRSGRRDPGRSEAARHQGKDRLHAPRVLRRHDADDSAQARARAYASDRELSGPRRRPAGCDARVGGLLQA